MIVAGVSIKGLDYSERSTPTDRDLVQSCLQGDRQSFRVLYQRHHLPVRSTLYQLCGASCLDDLVQDVFLRAWKGLKGFRQGSQFSTWLYRIAWNVASDQRRKFGQERSQRDRLTPLAMEGTVNSDLTQVHYQDMVQRGLIQLSEEQRSVLVLHDLQDLPQKEIAMILEIPIGTVKSRLFHARSTLRQFFLQEGVQL
ncbi:MAG: sigma-70 family RNA polymerase sigma factor [Prochlorotrichaceae cyanobacterium]|jgi:RNA polymerase sigma-70 factor (ECF subfamily)